MEGKQKRQDEEDDCEGLGWSELMRAVYANDLQHVKNLPTHGSTVCHTSKHGVTAFTIAVLRGDESLLKLLFDGLTPELQEMESNTALEVACVFGLQGAATWLLENTCAKINKVSTLTGLTPIHLATIGNNQNIIQLLLRHGADPKIKTALGLDTRDLGKQQLSSELYESLEKENTTPCQDLIFDFKETPDRDNSIDSIFSSNNIILDVNGDIVLKNSPCRPVFKTYTDQAHDFDNEIKLTMSPSARSVFLPSPKLCSTPKRYALSGLISPRYKPLASALENIETPKHGRKRKIPKKSYCSLWFKRLTKKGRARSLDESDDCNKDFDGSNQSGIDFLQLLFKLGLEEFYPAFKEQELDIWTFLTLSNEDLDAMGISDADSKNRILKGIKALRKTQL